MNTGALGKIYQDGENIVRQGEKGDCMYVILEGQVEVISEIENREIRLAVSGEGDFFGEMAILGRDVRGATVRAVGQVRALTVDKASLLRGIHKDPSLAFRMLETMCRRIQNLNAEMSKLKRAETLRASRTSSEATAFPAVFDPMHAEQTHFRTAGGHL
jgi:CRP/FNR family cyclic AMP-dependent transcriptional regulator